MLEGIFQIKGIDHYAIVVRELDKSRDFHVKNLGFSLKDCYELKTSEESPDNDTIACVLTKCYGEREEICVINQPLNSYSFLNQYILKCGEGIHHIAYSVDNLRREFNKGLENHIDFTSDQIIFDHINKLYQVFIDKKYTGYFIELIQREPLTQEQTMALFSNNNIKELIINTAKSL